MNWFSPIFLGFLFLGIASTAYSQLEQVENYYQELENQSKQHPVTLHFLQSDTDLVNDYSRLSQIILIRHGEPALDKTGWKKRSEAIEFIIDYDSVGVFPPAFIPLALTPNELNVIYTSTLNRTISTAQQVFKQDELLQSDPMFREFERKIFAFPNMKLPLKSWLIGSRVLWYVGLNKKGIESRSAGKVRAQKAALFLEQDAIENGKTVLVAHGFFNKYLEKSLKKQGWQTVFDGGNGYLSQKMLVRYSEK